MSAFSNLVSMAISILILFSAMVVLAETGLRLLKIRQGRLRVIIRLLPFIAVLSNLFLANWQTGASLNPLHCSSCAQNLIGTLFKAKLNQLLISENTYALWSGFWLFLAVTIYHISKASFELFIASRNLLKLEQTAILCQRIIKNKLLKEALKKHNVRIFENSSVSIPMATYANAMHLPQVITDTSPQEEFEAIVAHELEHLIWRDPALKIIISLTTAFFWWLPANSWVKKLELDQEIACDQSVNKYGIDKVFLAEALVKTATATNKRPDKIICYLTNTSHQVLKRLRHLYENTIQSEQYERPCHAIFTTGLTIVLTCFWLL